MSKKALPTVVIHESDFRVQPQPNEWIRDGWDMAQLERQAAFDTIELKHAAEAKDLQRSVEGLKARGHVVLQQRNELDRTLTNRGYDPGEHLRQMAHGKLDLALAIGLFMLNAALAVLVLLAFGPTWLTIPLALLVLVSALPVEEFLQAHEDQSALREGIFIVLGVLALAAQFWLGSIRGLFLAALSPTDAGPVTHVFNLAGHILQYVLGILALVSECLCGYKLYRARTLLLSATAKAVRERDRCNAELTDLHATVEQAKEEPDIRRAYRQVGARQYLSWHAGEAERAEARQQREKANHLRKAVKGGAIALLVLSLLLILAAAVSASPLPGRNVAILIDLTRSVSAENFQADLQAVSSILGRVQSGDRIIILGITDSFGNPAILLDHTMAAESGYLDFQLQASRETLSAKWQKIAKDLPAKPKYLGTDLVGCLSSLPYLGDFLTPQTCLIIFSDLRHNTPNLNLENVKEIAVQKALYSLRQSKSIPPLKGARVFLLGVDPNGKSQAYLRSLKEFWVDFFQEAGADVQAFCIDRRVPEF